MSKDLLELGKIVAIHALKGEIRLQPWCDTPDFATGFKKVYLKSLRYPRQDPISFHEDMILLPYR